MADGVVQVAPDSTGAKIDQSEVTRDDGTVVERQRVVISDDENPRSQAALSGEAGRGSLDVGGAELGILRSIDTSLKVICVMLAMAFEHDLDAVRTIVDLND
jgi:hypothetical protein